MGKQTHAPETGRLPQRPTRSPVRNLIDALRLCREASLRLFALVMTLPLLEAGLAVVLLVLLRGAAEQIFDAPDAELISRLLPWTFAAIGVATITLISGNARYLAQELLLDRVRVISAQRMHTAIAALELIEFDDPEVHDRIQRAETTADSKPRAVVRGSTTLIMVLAKIVGVAGFLVVLEPLILPLMLLAGLPIAALSARLAGERFRFHFGMTGLERRRRYLGSLLTARSNAAEIRLFGLERFFAGRYEALSKERHEELRQMTRRQWRSMLAGQTAFILVLISALAVLGWLFGSGRLDSAGLVTAVVGLNALAAAVGELGGPITELGEASMFLEDQHRFYEQMADRRRKNEPADTVPLLDRLELSDVSFTYPTSDRPALRHVDLTIERGDVVAFVGPNGSGKTTLAKILAFLYTPIEGSIRWNDVDVEQLDRRRLRNHLAVVFQDHVTYHFTIAENIAFGDVSREYDVSQVERVARDSRAHEFIDRLPQKYNTLIGPEFFTGTAVSVGQAQRLAISRALYRDRDLVIMDEPTSSLDPEADEALMGDFRSLLNGRTGVIISHRFSNVRHADRIYVFEDGRVIECGTHDQLLSRGGRYAEMYTLQARQYESSLPVPPA